MTRPYPYIGGFEPEGVLYVLQNLMPHDQIEAFDLTAIDDAYQLFAAYTLSAPGYLAFFTIRPSPLEQATAIMGLSLHSPGMGRAHLLATPDLHPRDAAYLARRIRTEMPNYMAQGQLHRVDCACLADHATAPAFLRAAGAKPEATLTAYGKSASTYHQFAWLKGDIPCVRQPQNYQPPPPPPHHPPTRCDPVAA